MDKFRFFPKLALNLRISLGKIKEMRIKMNKKKEKKEK